MHSIPRPDLWIDSFKQHSTILGPLIYGYKIKGSCKIHNPDYAGYFIEPPDRVSANDSEIYIKYISEKEKNYMYHLNLMTHNCNIIEYFEKMSANSNGLNVRCGNVTFSQKEWTDYINTNRLPKDFNRIKTSGKTH